MISTMVPMDAAKLVTYLTSAPRGSRGRTAPMVNEVNAGVSVKPDKVTVGQRLEDYLDGRHDLQPTSLQTYRDIFARHAAPIAHIQLQKLRPIHVKTGSTDAPAWR